MTLSKYKLSIVVPCYNEADNIPLIFKRFKEVLRSNDDVEIILVNNGSKDNSRIFFDNQMADYNDPRFKVIDVPVNQGYGYGILEGLKVANGNVLSWTHADMQTDPKDVIVAFDLYKENGNENIFIKGSRKKRKLAEAFFTWGMQAVSTVVLGIPLRDINAQPKMFSRMFYNKYINENAPWDFSLDLYVLYQAKRTAKIYEIPVYFNKRMHGEAKGGGSFKSRLKLIKRTFKYIFELRQKIKK